MFLKSKTVGIIAVIIASAGWATIGLWVKNIEMGFVEIAFFRFLISGFLFLLCTGIFLFMKKKIMIEMENIPKAAGLGILFFLQILSAVYAYKNLSIGQAVILTNLHIFFMIIFHIKKVYKSRLILYYLSATVLLFFGIYLIFGIEGSWSYIPATIGICSSFLFASTSYLSEKILPKGAAGYLGIIFLSGAFFGLLFARPAVIFYVPATSVAYLLILCIFSTLTAQFSFLYSIKAAGSLEASILSYLTIIFGVGLDLFLKHFMDIKMLGGSVVVFLSIVFLTFLNDSVIDRGKTGRFEPVISGE